MKYTTELQEEIRAALQDESEYPYIGVRCQEVPFPAVGEIITHCSSIWDDGDETDETLNGISATIPEKIALYDGNSFDHGYYYGDYIAILAGDRIDGYGEDDGEIVMIEPEVIKIIR